MSTFKEKMMAKKIKKLEDLLDAEMLANERLAEMVAELKTRGPDIWKKGIVGVEKSEFDNMKTRVEVQTRKIKSLEEENCKLKERGKCHKDKRITVRSCDDRAEYNRQVMYIKSNPECKFIPERKWTKKSKKDQPLESS